MLVATRATYTLAAHVRKLVNFVRSLSFSLSLLFFELKSSFSMKVLTLPLVDSTISPSFPSYFSVCVVAAGFFYYYYSSYSLLITFRCS